MKKKIKLFDPIINNLEEKEMISILKSGFWASGAGSHKVKEFENKFRKYTGAKECVAVNSGTSALNLALSMANIKNKEVILPSLTFVSTAHAIILNGGEPVFVDINPKTLCLDPIEVKKAITKKTAVVVPVHFAGMAAELEKLEKICRSKKIQIIEDAAHAAGTKYKNRKIGSHGISVCFSFHPVKNLAMPTGGMICINHKNFKNIKKRFNEKRWCGITNRKEYSYDVREIGWNYYMNEFSAGLGLIQLKKLNTLNEIRRKIARRYHNEIMLKEKMPFVLGCSYHFYWILVKNRNKIMKKLKESGIETGIHYRPVHTMSMYNTKKQLPITESVGKMIISLPTHPNLTNSDVTKIISVINHMD
jgi:perosamine synthetase